MVCEAAKPSHDPQRDMAAALRGWEDCTYAHAGHASGPGAFDSHPSSSFFGIIPGDEEGGIEEETGDRLAKVMSDKEPIPLDYAPKEIGADDAALAYWVLTYIATLVAVTVALFIYKK